MVEILRDEKVIEQIKQRGLIFQQINLFSHIHLFSHKYCTYNYCHTATWLEILCKDNICHCSNDIGT